MERIIYSSERVAEKIKEYAKAVNISVRKLLIDTGLSSSSLVKMKNSMPKADNLAKIADYLDCSVDYLLGRVEAPDAYMNIGQERREEKPVLLVPATDETQTLQTIHLLLRKMDEPDQEYILQKSIEVLNAPKYKKAGELLHVRGL